MAEPTKKNTDPKAIEFAGWVSSSSMCVSAKRRIEEVLNQELEAGRFLVVDSAAHDPQVKALIEEVKDGYASVQDVGNGEFTIDGVVNVRAALDAALSIAPATPTHFTHHEPGEFGEGATISVKKTTAAR